MIRLRTTAGLAESHACGGDVRANTDPNRRSQSPTKQESSLARVGIPSPFTGREDVKLHRLAVGNTFQTGDFPQVRERSFGPEWLPTATGKIFYSFCALCLPFGKAQSAETVIREAFQQFVCLMLDKRGTTTGAADTPTCPRRDLRGIDHRHPREGEVAT